MTGITLEPDDVIVLDSYTYHRQLLSDYIEQVGLMPLPPPAEHPSPPAPTAVLSGGVGTSHPAGAAGASGPSDGKCKPPSSTVLETLGISCPTEPITKLVFLHNQWGSIMNNINSDNPSEVFHLAKVVAAWLIIEDPRHALELFASSLNILEALEGSGNNTETSDCLHILVSSTLSMIITHASIARIIYDIDEHRIAGPPQTRTMDNAILRYALGGLSDQLLSFLPGNL